jgi:hypothetical protein
MHGYEHVRVSKRDSSKSYLKIRPKALPNAPIFSHALPSSNAVLNQLPSLRVVGPASHGLESRLMGNLQLVMNAHKGKQIFLNLGEGEIKATGEVVEAGADVVCIKQDNEGSERLLYIPFSAIVYFHVAS